MKKKLSIAILLNNRKVPLWIFSSIEKLVNSNNAKVALVINNKPTGSGAIKKYYGIGILLLKLIEKIDFMIFRKRNNYNLLKDILILEKHITIYSQDTYPVDKNIAYRSLDELFLKIHPDIIVKFGEHYLNKVLFDIPRYGIWTFSIETGKIPGGFDYGFWEVFRYRTISFSTVEVIGCEENRKVTIFESKESTCPFSINKNRNNIFFRASLFLPRLAESLQSYGEDYFQKQKQRYHNLDVDGRDNGISTATGKVIRDAFKYAVRIIKLVINKFFFTDAFSWQLLIKLDAEVNSLSCSFSSFIPLKSPKNVFWADPFVV
ncbi:MAG: hypothetical protein GX180_05270, partial [Enterococcus sp.]|nr:hypothetical protein [Enterococcus sp.]